MTAPMWRWDQRGSRCRVVVATHPAPETKSRIGHTRQGLVLDQILFTELPQDAFTASDVVALYLHRGAFVAAGILGASWPRPRWRSSIYGHQRRPARLQRPLPRRRNPRRPRGRRQRPEVRRHRRPGRRTRHQHQPWSSCRGSSGRMLPMRPDAPSTAWETTLGRPDVTIAVMDSGIKWNDAGAMSDLRLKVRLNTGELPLRRDVRGDRFATGHDCAGYTAAVRRERRRRLQRRRLRVRLRGRPLRPAPRRARRGAHSRRTC